MYIVNRLRRSLANRDADVFLPSEFASFGSPAQVNRALTELQNKGVHLYARQPHPPSKAAAKSSSPITCAPRSAACISSGAPASGPATKTSKAGTTLSRTA